MPELEHTQIENYETVEHLSAIDRFLTRPLARRTLLTTLGATAAVTVLNNVDNFVMDMHYGHDATQIVLPGTPDIGQPLNNLSLATPGWNDTNGARIVSQLVDHDIYPQTFPSAYYQFGNSISIGSLSNTARNFTERLNPQEVDVHGISEGAIIGLTGALASQRHLRLVSVNDSPFDMDDVRHSTFARVMVEADRLGIYRGDILGKFCALMFQKIENDGLIQAFQQDVGKAWHQTWDELDPRLAMQQLSLLEKADIWQRRGEVRRILTPSSHLIIMKTQQTATDKIVQDNQATEKWAALADYCKAPYTVVDIPVPGHAPIGSGYGAAAEHMRRIIEASRL